jgi:hypothetical protein
VRTRFSGELFSISLSCRLNHAISLLSLRSFSQTLRFHLHPGGAAFLDHKAGPGFAMRRHLAETIFRHHPMPQKGDAHAF